MTLALDSNNDTLLAGTHIARVSKGGQVAQMVRSRLLFYQGEWFLDTSVGVPYLQDFFSKPANVAAVESRLKTEILTTDGVDELLSFELVFDTTTRSASVAFEATTIYDEIIREEVYLNV